MIGIIGGVTVTIFTAYRARKPLSLVSFLTTNVPEAEPTQAEEMKEGILVRCRITCSVMLIISFNT